MLNTSPRLVHLDALISAPETEENWIRFCAFLRDLEGHGVQSAHIELDMDVFFYYNKFVRV